MKFKNISELPNLVGEKIEGVMEKVDKPGISVKDVNIYYTQVNEGKDSIMHILGKKIEGFLDKLEK